MRISARADYAVRAAVVLAAAGDGPTKGEAIAQAQSIPLKFLENILGDLRHAGLVRSQRGADGGYWLGRPAGDITVADVIRAVEGPLASVRGGPPEEVDYQGAAEPLQQVWIAVRASLRSVVERVTLADVADRPPARARGQAGRGPRGVGDALAAEIAATDYHTARRAVPDRDGGRPADRRRRPSRERREHAAASEAVDDGPPAAVPRAARARRHVRLLPGGARRRRRRPRRALLAQGRLLDRVRARDDRARRVGRRVGPVRRAARRRGRRDDRRARPAASWRACGCAAATVECGRLPQRARRSSSRATCEAARRRRSTCPTAARSTPRSPPRASGLRVVARRPARADRRRPRGQGGARRAPTSRATRPTSACRASTGRSSTRTSAPCTSAT